MTKIVIGEYLSVVSIPLGSVKFNSSKSDNLEALDFHIHVIWY